MFLKKILLLSVLCAASLNAVENNGGGGNDVKNDGGDNKDPKSYRGDDLLNPQLEEEFWSLLKEKKLTNFKRRTASTTYKTEKPNYKAEPILASDGRTIDYHIFFPKEFFLDSQKPFPVMFHVYGGGDVIDFNPDNLRCNILSKLGCIVVVLNGEPIPKEETSNDPSNRIDYRNFPKRLFQDIKEAVEYFRSKDRFSIDGDQQPLIREGAKIFLHGGSFGGYVTALMATNADYGDVFDGYIPFNGVWDWEKNMKESYQSTKSEEDFSKYDWTRNAHAQKTHQTRFYFKDNYLTNDQYNKEISPLYHLKNLKKPMLVVTGIVDDNVSPNQAIRVIEQSRKDGTHDLMRFWLVDRMGHYTPNRHEKLNEFKALYQRYVDFMRDVIDGKTKVQDHEIPEMVGSNEFTKKFNEKLKKLNNTPEEKKRLIEAMKKWKKKRAQRLINATNPTHQTQEGILRNMLHTAYYDKKNNPIKQLIKDFDEIPSDQTTSKERRCLDFIHGIRALDEATRFNLLHKERLSQKMVSAICEKAPTNKGSFDACKKDFSIIDHQALEKADQYMDRNLVLTMKNYSYIHLKSIKDDILKEFSKFENRYKLIKDNWHWIEKEIQDFRRTLNERKKVNN
jgi:hypothetical protein